MSRFRLFIARLLLKASRRVDGKPILSIYNQGYDAGMKATLQVKAQRQADQVWRKRYKKNKWVRSHISQRKRDAVFKRDGFTCHYCNEFAKDLTLDHIVPVSKGGNNAFDNLITACRKCNAMKADKPITQFLYENKKIPTSFHQ